MAARRAVPGAGGRGGRGGAEPAPRGHGGVRSGGALGLGGDLLRAGRVGGAEPLR